MLALSWWQITFLKQLCKKCKKTANRRVLILTSLNSTPVFVHMQSYSDQKKNKTPASNTSWCVKYLRPPLCALVPPTGP